MYVHIKSEPTLWTVGHYDPSGRFHPESDHAFESDATERVAVLNGGGSQTPESLLRALAESQAERDRLAAKVESLTSQLQTATDWWPLETETTRVWVTVGDGDGEVPWSAVFHRKEDAKRWCELIADDCEDARDHDPIEGDIAALRFWNTSDPIPKGGS